VIFVVFPYYVIIGNYKLSFICETISKIIDTERLPQYSNYCENVYLRKSNHVQISRRTTKY
jgi:hypothetical protein